MSKQTFVVLSAASMIVFGAAPALASSEVELVYAEVTAWSPYAPTPATQSALDFGDDEEAAALTLGGADIGTPPLQYYFEIAAVQEAVAGTVIVQIPGYYGAITNCAAKYATHRGDGRALYTATCPSALTSIKASVRYDVDGATYWDDNDGLGHTVAYAQGPRMPAGGVFHHGVPRVYATNGMQGAVVLESLPADAAVTMVYSADEWASASKLPLAVSSTGFVRIIGGGWRGKNPGTDGTTVHTFTLAAAAPKIRYHFVVESSIGSFTDDNEGKDYVFAP